MLLLGHLLLLLTMLLHESLLLFLMVLRHDLLFVELLLGKSGVVVHLRATVARTATEDRVDRFGDMLCRCGTQHGCDVVRRVAVQR